MSKERQIPGGTPGALSPSTVGRSDHPKSEAFLENWFERADSIRLAFQIPEDDFVRLERMIEMIQGADFRSYLLCIMRLYVFRRWIRTNVAGPEFKDLLNDFERDISCFEALRPRLTQIGVDVDGEISAINGVRDKVEVQFVNRKTTNWETDEFVVDLIGIYVTSNGFEKARISGGPKEEFAANPLTKFVSACLQIAGYPLSHDSVSSKVRRLINSGKIDLGEHFFIS